MVLRLGCQPVCIIPFLVLPHSSAVTGGLAFAFIAFIPQACISSPIDLLISARQPATVICGEKALPEYPGAIKHKEFRKEHGGENATKS